MTNIATMTSRDGIQAGLDSDLCRVQAVFIQWFLPADALFVSFNTDCRKHVDLIKAVSRHGAERIPDCV